jgi:hypothetical protein
MTETLAEKTCTPCRGGIPPLTRDEAQRFQALARLICRNSISSGMLPSTRGVASLEIHGRARGRGRYVAAKLVARAKQAGRIYRIRVFWRGSGH